MLSLNVNNYNVFFTNVVGAGEDHSDFLDEFFRQIQKKASYEKEGSAKGPLFGHPDLHRVLKDLVKMEGDLEKSKLEFSK